MTIVYIRTSDPSRLVAIPSREEEPVALVPAEEAGVGPHDWCMVNPLHSAAMAEARAVARAAGLRLRRPEQVAIHNVVSVS